MPCVISPIRLRRIPVPSQTSWCSHVPRALCALHKLCPLNLAEDAKLQVKDAPEIPPNDLALYSYERAAHDIAELAKIVGAKQIVLGGHDWGGMIVYRTAQW